MTETHSASFFPPTMGKIGYLYQLYQLNQSCEQLYQLNQSCEQLEMILYHLYKTASVESSVEYDQYHFYKTASDSATVDYNFSKLNWEPIL